MRIRGIWKAVLVLLVVGLVLSFSAETAVTAQSNVTTIKIENTVVQPNVKRLGINIGSYDQFGAAQYLKNLLPNPGFEGGEYGMVFLAEAGASANRVRANRWNIHPGSHPAGFWDGAQYEILTGKAKGRTGSISRYTIEGGRPTFYLSGGETAPAGDDAIVVRRPEMVGFFNPNQTPWMSADTSQKRPGSSGKQSLRVAPHAGKNPPPFYVALDSLGRDGDRSAGKLNIAQGGWKYSIWVKAERPNTQIEISMRRDDAITFHSEQFTVGTTWQRIDRQFWIPNGKDNPNGGHALLFAIRTLSGGNIWLDDAYWGQSDQGNPTVFSDSFVNNLRQLQPGVLRNWGKQTGSTLDNQLASEYTRQTVGYTPNRQDPRNWHYSLHEFLQLSQHVGADPWYVIPVNWSNAEVQNLIAYLSAPAGSHPYANRRAQLGQAAPWTNVFGRIHLEYGNELWGGNDYNDPFQGATLRGGFRTGELANTRFAAAKSSPHFQANKFNLIIGGQANFASRQKDIEATSFNHNAVGVAPYHGKLNQHWSVEQMYYPLFANPQQEIVGRMANNQANVRNSTELVVYEVNTASLGGAPMWKRNEFATSLGAGLALPLHMLTYQKEMGIMTQAAYQAVQYSHPSHGQWEKLWGLMRDVEATGRARPGWLALDMANEAIQGNMIATTQSGKNPKWTQNPANGITSSIQVPFVQSFAYKGWNGNYAIVLFNLNLYEAQQVQLQLPTKPWGNATMHTLTGDTINANNEDWQQVSIQTRQQPINQFTNLTLPKHSMVVLEWKGP